MMTCLYNRGACMIARIFAVAAFVVVMEATVFATSLRADNKQSAGTKVFSTYYASLKSNLINVRKGPGLVYATQWVYRRRHYPVQVIGRTDSWLHIRDYDQSTGWIFHRMVSTKRGGLLHRPESLLRSSPDSTAPAIAKLMAGVVAIVQKCPPQHPAWCLMTTTDNKGTRHKGWIQRQNLWGIETKEFF